MARETMESVKRELTARALAAEQRAHDAERDLMESRIALSSVRHQLAMLADYVDKLIAGGDGG
jgi:hypothetical protein